MKKSDIKAYMINSLKASVAITIAMAMDKELRDTVSDKVINLALDKNKEIYKAPIVHPVAFMVRIAVRNTAEAIEMHTIYDLDECTSKQVRLTLEACLNIAAKGTKQSVADVLNITNDDGSVPTICNRIMLAYAHSVDAEDSPVRIILEKAMAYFQNIGESSAPSESDLEGLFANKRYVMEGGKLSLVTPFTANDVSPFDDNYQGPDY